MSNEIKKGKRGRKPKPGSVKEYFTDETERAIVSYNSPDRSLDEKNLIYNKDIHKALKKLAYFTAKSYFLYFSKRYTIDDMENDLLIFAFNNLHMFNPENINKKGVKSKAFSYFSTICRNEAKHISERNFNQDKTSDDVVENINLFERDIKLSYNINENLDEDNDNNYVKIVFFGICNEIKNKIENDKLLKEIDVNVGYSLISIIENFNYINEPTESKMTLFFINNRVIDMICEITNNKYKKQEIKKSLKSFKSVYTKLKEDYMSS
jgi:hypothetical protein